MRSFTRPSSLQRALQAPLAGRATLSTTRIASQESGAQSKREDLMDRESINTTSTEGAQTGGGDSGAAASDTAFEPRKTDPGSQVEGVEKELGAGSSPASVSAGSKSANHDAAKMFDGQGGEAGNAASGGQRRQGQGWKGGSQSEAREAKKKQG